MMFILVILMTPFRYRWSSIFHNSLLLDHSSTAMRWDSLHRDARRLESELDQALSALSRYENDAYSTSMTL